MTDIKPLIKIAHWILRAKKSSKTSVSTLWNPVKKGVNGGVKYFFSTHHQPPENTGEMHTSILDHPPSSLDSWWWSRIGVCVGVGLVVGGVVGRGLGSCGVVVGGQG